MFCISVCPSVKWRLQNIYKYFLNNYWLLSPVLGALEGIKKKKNPTPCPQAREREARVGLDKASLRQVTRGVSARNSPSPRFHTGTWS